MVEIGDCVTYVDPRGTTFKALVTAVWGKSSGHPDSEPQPSLNLVIVSDDPAKDDCYGRQIERPTSIVHKLVQPAHAFYWV